MIAQEYLAGNCLFRRLKNGSQEQLIERYDRLLDFLDDLSLGDLRAPPCKQRAKTHALSPIGVVRRSA